MKTCVFVLLFVLGLASAVQAYDLSEGPQGEPEAVPYQYLHRIFVGCRPTPGECKNSCGNRRGEAEIDDTRCDSQDWRNRFACYCLYGTWEETGTYFAVFP